MRFGNGDYGQFTFLDYLTIASFLIGLENLDLNITQEDMDNQTADLDKRVNAKFEKALADIHQHLQKQDKKLDEILEKLEG